MININQLNYEFGVILADTKGELLYINDYAKEFLAKNFDNNSYEDSFNEIFGPYIKEAREYKREISRELSLNSSFGKYITLQFSVLFPPACMDVSFEYLILFRDITEEKEHLSRISESEDLFRKLAESTKVGILAYQGTRWIYINRAAEEITGYAVEEMLNMNFWDVVHPEHKEMVREKGLKRQRGEEVPPYELKIITKDGKEKWIFLSGAQVMVKGSEAAIVSVIDITPKKILENELRKREERYRDILENMEEGYFETDLRGNLTFVNNALMHIGEVDDIEKLINLNYRVFAPPKSAKKMFMVFHRVYRTGVSELLEDFEIITFKGNRKIVEISVRLIKDKQGNPSGFSGIVRDVTEKKKLIRETLKNRDYYKAIFENAANSIAIIDGSFMVTKVNRGFENLFRMNKSLIENRRYFYELISPDSREVFFETYARIKGGFPASSQKLLEIKGINAWGEGLNLLCSMSKIKSEDHIVISLVDVTPQKKAKKMNEDLEEQLRRSQKMEGIGLLASGIAHDFNNILQGIYSNLMFLDRKDSSSQIRARANIEKFIERGTNIVRELLSYARSSVEKFQPVNINNSILDISNLFITTLPPNIEIDLDLDKDVKNIHGDPVGIQQVLMNLITNAVDAIGSNRGSIIISTQNVHVKDTDTIPKGEYVCIKVSDSGMGIEKDDLSKIFDPFFSTKSKGKGTGLGLSIVKKIIEEHNGFIFCSSIKGKGTTFKIYIPAVYTGETQKPREAHINFNGKDKINRRNVNIFLIEDEEMILETSSIYLKDKGFNVVCAMNGKDAVEKFNQNHEDFDVIILDMNIPEISGIELLNKFLEVDPHKKIIVSTGYSSDILDTSKLSKQNIRFLQKPYSLTTLLDTILDVLN